MYIGWFEWARCSIDVYLRDQTSYVRCGRLYGSPGCVIYVSLVQQPLYSNNRFLILQSIIVSIAYGSNWVRLLDLNHLVEV